jgi:hypothetical protein
MSINPLNNISKVYLEQVAAQEVELDEGMTLKDYKKKKSALKQKEKRADAKTSPLRRAGIHADKASPERAARHRANVDPDFEGNDERNYPGGKLKNPKKIRKAKALGELGESSHLEPDMKKRREANEKAIEDMKKTKAHKDMVAAVRKKFDEALDPVGQEDADIDNDGDTDSSDKYLHKRRKTIGKAIAKKKGMKEGFSNWRQDLAEVMSDELDTTPIKEKKVKNKVKINPTLGEAVEQIGGTLIEMVEIENFEGIFDEMTESEIFFLNDSLIEQVVEDVFLECLEEGYDIEDVENTLIESLEISSSILNEAKVTLGHDTKIKSDRLEKVKSAVKKVGRGLARGAGYVAGAAARGVSAAKREFGKGYERGRGGSSSAQSSTPSSSSDSGSSKPGLLSRIGSKLKSGLKRAVAKGARAVSRGARNVARKMEGGETKKAETPKAAPKKAEKPADPWGEPTTPQKSKPKATTKKAAAPKAKAPARKKKASKLDALLSDIRSESVQQIDELSVNKMLAYKKKAEKNRDELNKKWDKGTATYREKMRVLGREEGEERASRRIQKKTGKHPYDMNKLDKLKAAVTKEETQIDEKTLTKMEMKKREEIVKSMKDKASDFEKRYPGRGKEVMYATATKMAKKMVEQMLPPETPSPESEIDKKKEMMDKQKIANMKMLQQKQQMLQKQKLQMQKSGKLPLETD